MKLTRLLENNDVSVTLRRVALALQSGLLADEHLGTVIEDIELSRGEPRSNLYDGLLTLHLIGPLLEFYIDISHDRRNEWTLEVRTEMDIAGDGALLSSINTGTANHSPVEWFNADPIMKHLLSFKASNTYDSARYNGIWFDKISRNLGARHSFFFKPLSRNGIVQYDIMTSQIIETDMGTTVGRYEITFAQTPAGGYHYLLGPWGKAPRVISDLNDMQKLLKDGV